MISALTPDVARVSKPQITIAATNITAKAVVVWEKVDFGVGQMTFFSSLRISRNHLFRRLGWFFFLGLSDEDFAGRLFSFAIIWILSTKGFSYWDGLAN